MRESYPSPKMQPVYSAVPADQSILKQILAGLNLEFSFFKTVCYTKVKEPSLPYYLPITGGRIARCIPFPRVFALCEMQTATFRFELVPPYPTTITIIPRAPPLNEICLNFISSFNAFRTRCYFPVSEHQIP